MMTRRQFSGGAAAAWLAGALGASRARAGEGSGLAAALAAIDSPASGRLGVGVIDTGSGQRWGCRADERFPMCSTFKALLAAAILARVDAGEERLDARVRFGSEDLVAHSPVTGKRAGGDGMTVAELCEATVTVSDNCAANLLLRRLGGPAGLTAFARTIGDKVTRLDRWETELNEATPGDVRDTTTPAAMAENLRRLIAGEGDKEQALSTASRGQFAAWLVATRTGHARLRAGFPADWRIGDKTGSGDRGTANDIGIVWPAGGRAPWIVTAYLTESEASPEIRDQVIAKVAQAVRAAIG